MTFVECSPRHLVLSQSHPLSKELYATVFGSLTPNVRSWYDVSSLTENPSLFRKVIGFLAERYRSMGSDAPTHILGVESRGYLVGAPLALALGIPFVLVRVTKRFPGSFVREDRSMMNLPQSHSIRNNSISNGSRIVLVDDFIASGTSIISAMRLSDIVGARTIEVVAICDVPYLNGVKRIHKTDDGFFNETPVLTLMRFQEDRDVLKAQLQALSKKITNSRL